MRSQGRSDRFVGLPMLTDWAIFFEHPQMLSSRVPLVLIKPDSVLVDGNIAPDLGDVPCNAIVKGDAKVPAISAASILAKVYRDDQMLMLHKIYPQYGFDKHKGYPTRQHLRMLKEYGPISQHRKTYKPVAAALRPHQ